MSYAYGATFTTDHTKVIGADQANVVILISVTDPMLADVAHGGVIQSATGLDMAWFSDVGRTAALNFHRYYWNNVTGQVKFYVLQPLASHTSNDSLYFACGDVSVVVDPQNKAATWANGWWDFFPCGDGTTLDLTGVLGHLLVNTGGVTEVAGPNLGAFSFNGTTQYLQFTGVVPNVTPLTIIGLAKPAASVGTTQVLFGLNQSTGASIAFEIIVRATDAVRTQNQNAGTPQTANGVLDTLSWHYIAGDFAADADHRLTVDAGAELTSVVSAGMTMVADDFTVGGRANNNTHSSFFNGKAAEFGVLTVATDSNWRATYKNNLLGTLGTFSAITSLSTATTAITQQPPVSILTGVAIAPAVKVEMRVGGVADPAYSGVVTASLLTGVGSIVAIASVNAIAGVATFTGLTITGDCNSAILRFTPAGGVYATIDSNGFAILGPAMVENLAFIAANGGDSVWLSVNDRRLSLTIAATKLSAWADAIGVYGGRTPGPTINQATGGVQPTITGTQGAGDERVVFNNNEWMASAADARFDGSLNAPLYIFVIYKATANGPIAGLMKDETSSVTYPYFLEQAAGGKHGGNFGTAAAGSPAASYTVDTGIALSATRRIAGIGKDGVDATFANINNVWRHFFGGLQMDRRTGVTACTAGSLKIVLGRLAALRGTCEIDWIGITTQRPTNTLLESLYVLGASHGASTNLGLIGNFTAPGDSLQYGSASTDPMTPVEASGTKSSIYVCVNRNSGLGTLAARGFDTSNVHRYNRGVSGDNFDRIRLGWDYDINIDNDGVRAGPRIVLLRGIGNYIQSNLATLAQVKAAAVLIKAKADATGWKILWETELDRASGNNGTGGNKGFHVGPGTGTDISLLGQVAYDFNAELMANWRLYGHFVPINTGARSDFIITLTAPNASEVGAGSIYDAGTVHLTDIGYAEVGNDWKDYLDANPNVLLPSISSTRNVGVGAGI